MTKTIKQPAIITQPDPVLPVPVDVSAGQITKLQQQVSLLTEHINFIYNHLGITSNVDSRFDNRRTETGMGAFINSKSDFV